jgi:hypothetical protein
MNEKNISTYLLRLIVLNSQVELAHLALDGSEHFSDSAIEQEVKHDKLQL